MTGQASDPQLARQGDSNLLASVSLPGCLPAQGSDSQTPEANRTPSSLPMGERTAEKTCENPFETSVHQKACLGQRASAGDLEAGSVTSPIEGIVVDWPDASPKKADNGEKPLPRRRCCRSRRCLISLACGSISLVAGVVMSFLFWPRDPSWDLVKLEVVTPDALMELVMFAAGGMQGDENTTFPEVKFYAEAEVHNPNLLGGEADPGDIQVFFKGRRIGYAGNEPTWVSPHSTGMVGVNSTILLNYHLFQDLMHEAVVNELKLTLQVRGGAWVTGPFGVRLFIQLECDVLVSVDEVFNEEARYKVLRGKACRYKYL
ncbi:unnamed protein product [Effrenium voratum]|uniref:Late embryogenesis abundant protein LEA-2 subgroup domain-containing protein n=1 Tax=Effrenium voratum TaxID=2562239 RepID=A0AA36N8I6_9DINO|nr:unnamed protein product [Effrenium voratum]